MSQNASTPCCRTTNATDRHTENHSREDMIKRCARDLVHMTCDELNAKGSDLITLKTIRYRILARCANALGLTWTDLCEHVKCNTLVHPEVAQQLKFMSPNDEEMVAHLTQDFIRTDKVVRLARSLARKGHQNEIDALFAVDGLQGSVSNGPEMDCKRYVDNLRFGLSDAPSGYDHTDDFKRQHVQAVRRLYNELDRKLPEFDKLSTIVFWILREVIRDVTGHELPGSECDNVSEETRMEGKGLYLSCVSEETVTKLFESLKVKVDKNLESEEDAGHTGGEAKKRKRVLNEKDNV